MQILTRGGVVEVSVVHCQAGPARRGKGSEDAMLLQCGQALCRLPLTRFDADSGEAPRARMSARQTCGLGSCASGLQYAPRASVRAMAGAAKRAPATKR